MNDPYERASRILWTVLVTLGLCAPRTAIPADTGILYGVRVANQSAVFRLLDLASVQPAEERGNLPLAAEERVTAIFQNPDRSVGLVRTSTRQQATLRAAIRLVGLPERLIDTANTQVSGLDSSHALSSLLTSQAGPSYALVSHYSDTPRFWVARVDPLLNRVTLLNMPLNPSARYAHLTQCPDGSIYTSTMLPQRDVRLIRLDIARSAVTPMSQLRIDGEPMDGELAGIACGPAGDLYVLSNAGNAPVNWLYRVDLVTGALTKLREFDVDRITFVR
jgi:hypothetical protein